MPGPESGSKSGAKTGSNPGLSVDPVLEQALSQFRQSVHAWSEAVYSRPRTPVQAARSAWRLAVGWALGCVLLAGGVSGIAYEHHHRQVLARLALQARQAQQRRAAQQRADEDLLATVDSDVSREVPAAMEPLAQLMDEDTAQ